jgi:hypothetical protein
MCGNTLQSYFNASLFTAHPKRQKEARKANEEAFGCVRPECVNKWPISLIAT